jgi:flagellar export protein FliJ
VPMSGPSFRFSLERVRALRERTEDQAKEALAGAMQAQLRSEHEAREAAERVARARAAQLDAVALPAFAHDLIARQAYLERSERAHRMSEEVLGRSAEHVQERRQALTEAARDRQALERLKEHRRQDHAREAARVESVVLDEIAINGHRRRAA